MTPQNPQPTAQTTANTNLQQYALTPASDTAPVVIELPNELSGPHWVARFPGSNNTIDLAPPFRENTERFISALHDAGASVTVSATFRPVERAFLMHWCWRIAKQNFNASNVENHPNGTKEGVNIDWAHRDENGQFSQAKSVQAAQKMVNGYGINGLHLPPSLTTRHTQRLAIDMSISWSGTLSILDASGQEHEISTHPRDGMNHQLASVGLTYNVRKFVGGAADKPHWSNDGH